MATVSRARIRRNVLLNLAGFGLPLAAALVAVPVLLHGLGRDRFGVVALALTLVTVVGVLDLGFGRAMTQAVAARIGCGEESQTGALVGTAAAVTAALGILLAAGLFAVAPVVVYRVLEVPDWLQSEAVDALRVLALAVPAVLLGFAFATTIPVVQVMLAGVAPDDRRGAVMSLNGTVLRLGQTLGPPVMALVHRLAGIDAVFYAGAVFALALAAMMWFAVRR